MEKTPKIYKTLAKDTGMFAISRFASKLLVFFLTPLYTYVLSTDEFGIADLLNTTIHFIYPLLTLAIADAAMRFALDKGENQNAVFNNSLLITLLGTVVLCLMYPLMARISSIMKGYWIVFVASFTLFNLQECICNFLKGIGKTKLFAMQGILHTVTIISCNILCLLIFQMGLQGYLLSIVVGHVVPIVFMILSGKLYQYWKPFRIDKQLLVKMLKYSIPMIPTLLAWAVNTSLDRYMIIGYLGTGQSGIYSVAHKIPSILTTVLAIFTQAWQLSAISNHGSAEESKYYTNVYKALNLVSVLVCMAIVVSAKWICGILFAEAYFSAWQCIPMLTIAAMFASHSGFLAAAFRAAKKTGGLLVSVAAGAAVNVLTNFVLIRQFGIVGASIGTAVGFVVLWLIRIAKIQKIVRVKIGVLKTIAEYAVMLLAATWITFELPFAYGVFALAFVLIAALNIKTMKTAAELVLRTLKRRRNRKVEE